MKVSYSEVLKNETFIYKGQFTTQQKIKRGVQRAIDLTNGLGGLK